MLYFKKLFPVKSLIIFNAEAARLRQSDTLNRA